MEQDVLIEDVRGERFVELRSRETPIDGTEGALALVSLCMEHDAALLLLHEGVLSEGFFRLGTGSAGEILQKLVNYGIRAAVVAAPERAQKGKFSDMAIEANRGRQFGVFPTREEAVAWLCS